MTQNISVFPFQDVVKVILPSSLIHTAVNVRPALLGHTMTGQTGKHSHVSPAEQGTPPPRKDAQKNHSVMLV